MLRLLTSAALTAFCVSAQSFDKAHALLNTYCASCHTGKAAAGGFQLQRLATQASLGTEVAKWTSSAHRVHNGEMPPKGAPKPSIEDREAFAAWVSQALRTEACSGGIVPGPALTRRLNRDEYTATLRDLLDMHLDVGRSLPADGAGGEGFDNAAETLFLSPLHSEKYMEVAKFAMDFAAKEYKSRSKILIATPGKDKTSDQAAREIIKHFLPQAFRRPVEAAEVETYFALYQAARKQRLDFEPAVFFALRGALVSPMFLFRAETPNPGSTLRLAGPFEMASRLSYFLWGSKPDEFLFDVAASGKLQDPQVLQTLVGRMLRNDRSLNFVQSFVEQWLRTRELTMDKMPDAALFPGYAASEETRSDIRLQPVFFFRELLLRDLPLTNIIDSEYTIGTGKLNAHYGIQMPLDKDRTQQPQWVKLPENSHRGGFLGMSAILTVSSYPYRTSPVLRGTWILDSMLGTPPPPPPENVPPLDDAKTVAAALTVRERLTQHRANAVCASCHSRIDGLGFALENYDAIGRWRDQDSGKPVDNSGELADGSKFKGPEELKTMLLQRKDIVMRNLASRMLGYALGRGLTVKDSCAVDEIVAQVKAQNYRAQSLIEAIVLSVPFRYQGVK
jgi:hypothetical protein